MIAFPDANPNPWRILIFAGAGISMAPPTNLPSWRDFNRVVVRTLARSAIRVLGNL